MEMLDKVMIQVTGRIHSMQFKTYVYFWNFYSVFSDCTCSQLAETAEGETTGNRDCCNYWCPRTAFSISGLIGFIRSLVSSV